MSRVRSQDIQRLRDELDDVELDRPLRPVRVSVFTRGLFLAILAAGIGVVFLLGDPQAQRDPNAVERSLLATDGGVVLWLRFSPDGRTLAVSRANGTLTLWDVTSHRRYVDFPPSMRIANVAFSPDCHTVALSNGGPTVIIWDLDEGETPVTFEAPDTHVVTLAFSTNSATLAGATQEGEIILWDTPSKQIRQRCRGLGTPPACLVFSPDNRTLASMERNGTLQLWDPEDGRLTATLTNRTAGGHPGDGSVVSAAFSPDGKSLATARTLDPLVRVWDVPSRTLKASLKVTLTSTAYLAFTPTDHALILAGQGSTIRKWHVGEPRSTVLLRNVERLYLSVAIAPDGETLALGEGETVTLCKHAAEDPHVGNL